MSAFPDGAPWWKCPNDPPCPHAGVFHDIYDAEDEVPRCCAGGCDCGKRPPGYDGPLTRAEWARATDNSLPPGVFALKDARGLWWRYPLAEF